MSKGLGKKQKEILKELEKNQTWTVETLRWFLFEENSDRNLSTDGNLPTSWNTAFGKAIQSLEERKLISICFRPLESLKECVEQYPGKTLKSKTRKLRKELLPILYEWTEGKEGLTPKYGAEENEKYFIRSLPHNKINPFINEWKKLEERLRPVYGNASSETAPYLLGLICKGKCLFTPPQEISEISARKSLKWWGDKVTKSEELPKELLHDINTFLNNFISLSTSRNLNFRSYIFEFADIPHLGSCKLRKKTLNYLLKKRSDIIREMEGFKELEKDRFSFEEQYMFPEPLYRLFDHTVFQKFKFLTLRKSS